MLSSQTPNNNIVLDRIDIGLPDDATQDIGIALDALRAQQVDGGAIAMLAIDDSFFIIIRQIGEEMQMMMSDALAALEYDIASEVLELLDIDSPEEDDGAEHREAREESAPGCRRILGEKHDRTRELPADGNALAHPQRHQQQRLKSICEPLWGAAPTTCLQQRESFGLCAAA